MNDKKWHGNVNGPACTAQDMCKADRDEPLTENADK